MQRDVNILDLENWLSNFPDLTKLRFEFDGHIIEWVGGRRECFYPTERGDLSPVEEVVTLEFTHGASKVQE